MMNGCFIPDMSHAGLQDTRSKVKAAFEKTGKNMKVDGGIQILQGQERNACQDLFDQFTAYGTFLYLMGK